MIKNILCKLGFHKYKMRQFMLTSSIGTIVKCKWCGKNLSDEMEEEFEKRRKKISKHKFNKESND